MQVFNAFLKVMKKKLPTAMIYIIVFLVISFSFANSSDQNPVFKNTKLSVCILDEDYTPESRALTEFIGKKHVLTQTEKDENKIKDALYTGTYIDYVMIIQKGYAEKLGAKQYDDLFGNYHVHDSYSEALMEQLLTEYLSSVRTYQAGGMALGDALNRTAEVLSEEATVTIKSSGAEDTNSDFPKTFSAYFRYMPYILISVLMSVLCPVLLAMSRKNIRNRTNCSCVTPSSFTLQIFAGSAVFVIAVWLVFMIAGAKMYGGIFHGKAWLAVLNSLIFSILSAAIAVLISAFQPGDSAVNLITQILGLGMSFLCGIFIPMEMLSSGILTVARFLPAYWYVKGNNIIAGYEPFESKKLIICMLIEVGFAAVIGILAIIVRRKKYGPSAQLTK